jgi:hypothetical protein
MFFTLRGGVNQNACNPPFIKGWPILFTSVNASIRIAETQTEYPLTYAYR